MRVISLLRARFMRMESRRDWRLAVGMGGSCIVMGLFAFWVSSAGTDRSLWSSYIFPTLMLVMGCINLFVAWRRRHWTFDR